MDFNGIFSLHCRKLGQHVWLMKKAFVRIGLLTCLLGTSSWADLPDLGEVSDTSMSLADEARIGRRFMRELRQAGDVVDDIELSTYLTDLGGRIASSTRASYRQFTFFGVNSYTINAAAMPGGYIGVNVGLVLATQSEGELASVLAHEVAHVTQRHLARMQAADTPNQLLILAAIAAAALMSRAGDGQATLGALSAGVGLAESNRLAFSRDFEREADRVGMHYLGQAGFDVRSMSSFFERMQQNNRYSDNNAFAFLRTHPVTLERISEAQDRAESYPIRMRVDSTSYLLVREKLRVMSMSAADAVAYYQKALDQRLFLNEGAAWYGMARAQLAVHDVPKAQTALKRAELSLPAHSMLFTLGADIARDAGHGAEALSCYQQGLSVFPSDPALIQGEIALLIERGAKGKALERLHLQQELHPNDPQLYRLEAKIYTDSDALRYHAALGNALYFEQSYEAALEQYYLASAIKTGESDFFLRSSIEARTRELEKMLQDEKGKRQ